MKSWMIFLKKFNMILPVWLLLALFLVAFPQNVCADTIDTDAIGSITVTMMDTDGNAVGGGEIEIFYVAEVTFDEILNPHYLYTSDFEDCSYSILEELTESESASALREYVEENGIDPLSEIEIDESGVVVISDLPVGVYLVVQTKAADGYNSVGEFIVTIPLEEGVTLIYDVDATPKVKPLYKNSSSEDDPDTEIETEPVTESESEPESESDSEPVSEPEPDPESESDSESESEPETETESESEPENETDSEPTSEADPPSSDGGTPTIPQTGLILWPIQTAAGVGLVLMIIGWILVSPGAFTKGRHTKKTKYMSKEQEDTGGYVCGKKSV